MKQRWLQRAGRGVVLAGLIIAWAGILCRGRDGNGFTQTLSYGTPWLTLLAAGLLALTLLRHRALRLAGALCMVVAFSQGVSSFAWKTIPPAPAGAMSISVWNAGRDFAGREMAWSEVADADLSAVIEVGGFTRDQWSKFQATCPDHHWQRLDTSIMLGVRGRILSHESRGVHDFYRCHRVTVDLPRQGRFTVVVVDIRSQPWLPRGPILRDILAAATNDPRSVIIGDFNTPPDSRWFRKWRDCGFYLANDAPRRGFRETWAHGLPLLTLDHVWLSSAWLGVSSQKSHHGSDHARVKCIVEKINHGN